MNQRPDSSSNICSVQLDIPWGLAEQLIPYLSNVLNVLVSVIGERAAEDEVHARRKAEGDKQAEENKAKWAALAQQCEAEIARRSNQPGSRKAVIKQLAAELKVPHSFLASIIKVHRGHVRQSTKRERTAEILKLRISGKSTTEIGAQLGITPRMVRLYLAQAPQGVQPSEGTAKAGRGRS